MNTHLRIRLPRIQIFDSWIAYRDYRFLWVANFCGNTAQWLQLLTAGWLVRELAQDTSLIIFKVILVGGLANVPVLFVGPLTGVLADRVDRRKLIIANQSVMVLAAGSFSALVAADVVTQFWHVYIYVFLCGICRTISMPMQQVLIANTVPRESVSNAFAANVLTIPGTRMIGPLFGGVMIVTLGFAWNFALEAVLYAGAVLALLPMRTPFGNLAAAASKSFFASLKEGVSYIYSKDRVIFNLTILSFLPNVLLQPLLFLLPIFTVQVFAKEADVGGYLLATTGLGGFISAVIIASVGWFYRKGWVCLAATFTSAACAILFAQSEILAASFVIIGFFSFSQAYFRTTNGTLIQILAPDHLRGRITSLQNYGQGVVVFSSLLIGVFAEQTSAKFAFTVVGLVGLVLSLAAILTMHRLRRQE